MNKKDLHIEQMVTPEKQSVVQPNFKDILNRMAEVDSGKRILTPLSPNPEEWNRHVRMQRRRLAHKVASIAAAVAVVIGVVGGAFWLGRKSVIVPNLDNSTVESGEASSNTNSSTVPPTTTTSTGETSVTRLPDGVATYEEAIRRTGLPLVKADGMSGFEGYVLENISGKATAIIYSFKNYKVSIYNDNITLPTKPELISLVYDNKEFFYKETDIEGIGNQIAVYYVSPDGVLFVGNILNKTVDESVKLLNALIFK